METQTATDIDVNTTESPMNFSQPTTNSVTHNMGINPYLMAPACILIVICIVGLIGNMFVIVAVALSRRLQTPTNAFVVTLSCVDFLSALVLPFQAGALLGATDAHTPYVLVCEVVGAITCVVNFWSFSLLVVIAFGRYLIITRPSQNPQMLFSQRKIAAVIVLVLAIPIILLIIFLCVGRVHFGLFNHLCGVVKGRTYNYLVGACTLISMVAMVFCYVGIYSHVRNHVQKVRNSMRQSMRVDVQGNPTMSIRARERKVDPRQLDEQITRNLFVVVLFFFVCIAPTTVTFFTFIDPPIFIVFYVIMSLNYCVNPIIYAWRHPVFRKVFRCMIARRLEDIKEPSQWIRKILTPSA